jgi:hypothetical protein
MDDMINSHYWFADEVINGVTVPAMPPVTPNAPAWWMGGVARRNGHIPCKGRAPRDTDKLIGQDQ